MQLKQIYTYSNAMKINKTKAILTTVKQYHLLAEKIKIEYFAFSHMNKEILEWK